MRYSFPDVHLRRRFVGLLGRSVTIGVVCAFGMGAGIPEDVARQQDRIARITEAARGGGRAGGG